MGIVKEVGEDLPASMCKYFTLLCLLTIVISDDHLSCALAETHYSQVQGLLSQL